MTTEKPVLSRHESHTSIPAGTPIVEVIDPDRDSTDDASKPPDGGYGWICCFGCCIINGFTWGISASFGVYLSYYLENDLFPGASDVDYAYIGGANFAAAMLSAVITAPVLKLIGTNATIVLGTFIYSGGWIAASFSKTFWQLCLAQGVCVGVGVGFVWQPSIVILPQWFSKKRSLAQGIASCGSGFGGLIFSLATTPMIERMSLAWSMRITGIVTFVLLLCAAFMVRDRNELIVPRSKIFDKELMKRYQVCMLLAWGITTILGYMVMVYSLSSFAIDIGLTQEQGGIIIALQNVGTALFRPTIGIISDRYGRITTAASITALNCILAWAVWIPANGFGVLAFLGFISGGTIGVYWGTIAPLGAEVVGLVDLPSILNMSWLWISMPTLFSEVIALKLRRKGVDRPYLYPQIYAGAAFFVSTLCLLELRRVKWGWVRERHS